MIIANNIDTTRGFIFNLWNGNYSMPRTYWLYGVLYPIIVSIIAMIILMVLGAPLGPDAIMENPSMVLGVAGIVMFFGYGAYMVIWLIGAWRSTRSYIAEKRESGSYGVWGYVVRVIIVYNWFSVAMIVLAMFTGGQ